MIRNASLRTASSHLPFRTKATDGPIRPPLPSLKPRLWTENRLCFAPFSPFWSTTYHLPKHPRYMYYRAGVAHGSLHLRLCLRIFGSQSTSWPDSSLTSGLVGSGSYSFPLGMHTDCVVIASEVYTAEKATATPRACCSATWCRITFWKPSSNHIARSSYCNRFQRRAGSVSHSINRVLLTFGATLAQ